MEGQTLEARVHCNDCDYSTEVKADSEDHPIDLVNQHEIETGHTVEIDHLD